jgi:uncharacterized protein YegL
MILDERVEFAENPEPRCPVILLVDTSGSMSGERIRQLNQGISVFKEETAKDDIAKMRAEIAIVTFGGSVNLRQDFVTIDDFQPVQLVTEGNTPMGQAIEYALNLVENRKEIYRSNSIQYYRPWIFLITDGGPTDEWKSAAQKVHQYESSKKITFFAVGVQEADMDILRQISPPGRLPVKLQGLSFTAMFTWLSASMSRVSTGKVGDQQALEPISDWGSITT